MYFSTLSIDNHPQNPAKMIRAIFTTIVFMIVSLSANAQLEVKQSPHSPEETMAMLKEIIIKKGLTIFNEVDHAEQAQQVGMELHSVGILSFGDPKVGTLLMRADPHVAIELPLKIMVFERNGRTMMGYTDPETYSEKYNLEGQEEILKKMHNLLEEMVETVVNN